MTKEVEPSVKDERVERLRTTLTAMWHDEAPADYRSCGNIHDNCDDPYPLDDLDSLAQQLQEAIERAEKAEAEVKVWWGCFPQGPNVSTDIVAAKLDELDAAIAEKDEWKRGAEAAYAAHDATMAQLQEAEATLARWVDNDPSVSPGENIRMMQDALAQQLSESEKERERLREALDEIRDRSTCPSHPTCPHGCESIADAVLSPDSQEKERER